MENPKNSEEKTINLQERFPNMIPVKNPPGMYTVNGIGTSVYGKKNFDELTQTYLKTYCICILFIPVLALRSYRVMDAAQGGWYFLGREPLSGFAKFWNRLVLGSIFLLISLGIWGSYTSSPEYIQGQNIQTAEGLYEKQQYLEALEYYADAASSRTSHRKKAEQRIEEILRKDFSVEQAQQILAMLYPNKYKNIISDEKAFAFSYKIISEKGEKSPKTAIELLDKISELAPEGTNFDSLYEKLIGAAVKLDPNDLAMLAKLAAIYEKTDRLALCENLLAPHAGKLGKTEGARILGQLYAHQGKLQESHNLLMPYTLQRLEDLKIRQKEYNDSYKRVQQRYISFYEKRLWPSNFYSEQFKRQPEKKQQAELNAYLDKQISEDPDFKLALDKLIQATGIVSVAMELGIVKLHLARNETDPNERKKSLEAAEKIFLDIRGVAGDRDDYNLSLGQVYYWLGKKEEGKELFDKILENNQRSSGYLIAICRIMRELGDVTEAFNLAEEAYKNAKSDEDRYGAAMYCSLTVEKIEDKIEWLRKSDQNAPNVIAMLNNSLGDQALSNGDYKKAEGYLKKAIEGYGRQQKSSTTLNNSALVYFSLFEITSDPKNLEQCIALLEEALALNPSHSIILANVARYLIKSAVIDIMKETTDIKAALTFIDLGSISYVYDNDAEWQSYLDKLRNSEKLNKTAQYLEKLLVLSPETTENYSAIANIHNTQHDYNKIKAIYQQIYSVRDQLPYYYPDQVEVFSGKKDQEMAEVFTKNIKNYQKLLEDNSDALTQIIVGTNLISSQISGNMYGIAVNPDDIVVNAKKYLQLRSSLATRNILNQALLFRAGQQLAKKLPEYQQIHAPCQRTMSHATLIAYLLSQNNDLSKRIAQHPDVQAAIQGIVEKHKKFSKNVSIWDWAILSSTQPKIAAKIAKTFEEDQVLQTSLAIDYYLKPMSAYAALTNYWALLMSEDQENADKMIQLYIKRGVPIPVFE